jgi:hypothetical protein
MWKVVEAVSENYPDSTRWNSYVSTHVPFERWDGYPSAYVPYTIRYTASYITAYTASTAWSGVSTSRRGDP